MASDEVKQATGEAPTAQEQLVRCSAELQQAAAELAAAELSGDFRRTAVLEDEIGVLHRLIEKLTAKAAVEAATEAQGDAVALRERLAREYGAALAALAPNLDHARRATAAAAAAAHACTTTWAAAARLLYEVRILEMRFAIGEMALDALPTSPVAALVVLFGDEIERAARLSIRQPLPAHDSTASNSPEQTAVYKMIAAHEAVSTLGADLKLSSELLALFAKAGMPERKRIQRSDPAVIGTSEPRPSPLDVPGILQGAIVGVNPSPLPLTPEAKAEREENIKRATRRNAQVLRAASEDEKIEAALTNGKRGMRG